MKLKKCLKITKSKKFEIYVYPKGHIKYNRGIDEVYTELFSVVRNENGKIQNSEQLEKYKDYKVMEIIPNSTELVGIVVEPK